MLFRLVQGVIGVSLAVGLLFGAGVATARYFMTRLTTLPPRPTFAEENPETAASTAGESNAADLGAAAESVPETAPAEAAADADLVDESNAYQARVVQPIGLVLRQGPDSTTTQIGGIDYNEELTVLTESEDGQWLQVRLLGSEVVGWVKAGNTEPMN